MKSEDGPREARIGHRRDLVRPAPQHDLLTVDVVEGVLVLGEAGDVRVAQVVLEDRRAVVGNGVHAIVQGGGETVLVQVQLEALVPLRPTGTVVVPGGFGANTSFTDRYTRAERPTLPARTCTPIATRSGRSRWPNGPWAARSAARRRSSASTSSRTLLLRISGLRVVPGTPWPSRPERAEKGGAATT